MRSIGHTRVVALVVAGLVLGAGCGGSGSDDSADSAADPAAATQTDDAADAEPADTDDASDDASDEASDDGGQGSSEIPDFPDATWNTGRIHMEVTGDVSDSFESDGQGAAMDGFASAAFVANQDRTVSLGFGGDTESAISFTAGGVSSVGGFESNCSINFTQADAAGVAADFTCDDLQAVAPGTTDVSTIDVKGNFTLSP